jgi:hypothetical protein
MAGAMTAAREWVIRPGRVEMIHFRKRAALWSAKKAKKGTSGRLVLNCPPAVFFV